MPPFGISRCKAITAHETLETGRKKNLLFLSIILNPKRTADCADFPLREANLVFSISSPPASPAREQWRAGGNSTSPINKKALLKMAVSEK